MAQRSEGQRLHSGGSTHPGAQLLALHNEGVQDAGKRSLSERRAFSPDLQRTFPVLEADSVFQAVSGWRESYRFPRCAHKRHEEAVFLFS